VTPERWKRLRAAIEAALETSPARRDALLAEACAGDPGLLGEARSIMRAAEDTRASLAPSAATTDDTDATTEQRPPLLGRRLGHYQIEQHLGAGGMGEVFRARDLALGRETALKVLPRRVRPELRQRLLREAEAAARLQHPCIATFFEAGEEDDEAFIAMEFVQGETLRARLRRGPLPLDESLALARCLLGALGHAHAAGLLHRDIKPENVMVTGPRSAKLLDFGLACGLAAATQGLGEARAGERARSEGPLTSEGMIIGTVGYMSPEQVRGEALDARSDLFQAGIVLYECVFGRPAFSGRSPHERLAAAVGSDVDLGGLAWRGLPAELAAILGRALARDRGRRYPTAMAFLHDLARLHEGRLETEIPEVLAVTDFENLTRDPDVNWLGAGIAETLVSELSRVSGLAVLPRPRVARAFKVLADAPLSSNPDLELGLALGCGWVLSGAYQRTGGSIRMTFRLTDVSTGQAMPAEMVDGTLDEVFVLQDRLARAVVEGLRLRKQLPSARKTTTVRVFELVTRARSLSLQLRREALDEAIGLLEEALRLDPASVPAHAALAHAHAFRAIATTNAEDLDRAIDQADHAIALDASSSEAYKWKGYALWRQERWSEARPVLRRAVELAPDDAQAHYFVGAPSFMEGEKHEALPYLQRSLELEPWNAMGWLALGAAHLALLNLPEAQYALARCLELERNPQGIFPTAGAAAFLGETLRLQGRLAEARQRALEGIAAAEASDHPYRDVFRAYGLCVLGRITLQQGDVEGARAAFGQVVAHLRGRTRPRSCGHLMVQALAGLGRTGDASAFEEGLDLFETRHTWNFERFNGCLPEQGLMELARAARALGRAAEAETLLVRAREAGSLEPAD
jgi:serine/threonine protein kinase/tetratricopeptide (TPR) repeat protein